MFAAVFSRAQACEIAKRIVAYYTDDPNFKIPSYADHLRIEEKLDALIKALKAHGVGAWTE